MLRIHFMSQRIPQLIVVGRGISGTEFLARAVVHHLADHYRIRSLDEHANSSLSDESKGFISERETVLAIDPARHVLNTASGRVLEYDALVLATGMSASVPENLDHQPRCFVYRVASDLQVIRRAAQHCQRAVVVGGGRHGLQVAQLLRGLGLETHIVEQAVRLLPRWVDDTGAVVLHSRVAKQGVEMHFGSQIQDIVTNAGRLSSVCLADGSEIACDLVVVCPGAHARDELGRASGLKLGGHQGIAIDEHCHTSEEGVFAVGGVASYNGHCLNWQAARKVTAETVACTLVGEPVTLRSLRPKVSFRALGVPVACFGDAFADATDTSEISVLDTVGDTYARLTISANGRTLLGGMFVGSVRHCEELHDYYASNRPLPKQPGSLLRILSQTKRGGSPGHGHRSPGIAR
jgi:nitrite reductase (NADH) large subunit